MQIIDGSGVLQSTIVQLSSRITMEAGYYGKPQVGDVALYTDGDHPGDNCLTRPQVRVAFGEDGRTVVGVSVIDPGGQTIMSWER